MQKEPQLRRYVPGPPGIFESRREPQEPQDWLEVPIGGGWIAAYGLRHSGRPQRRRTRITELRIVPDGPNRKAGQRGDGRRSQRFSFDRLRRGVTERQFATCLAATVDNAAAHRALAAFGDPGQQLAASPREGRGAGRPPIHSRAFYARVALSYERIEHDDRREPQTSTRQALARKYGEPVTTIAKWLRVARRKGFLTKAKRGGRRSRATDLARETAAKERQS